MKKIANVTHDQMLIYKKKLDENQFLEAPNLLKFYGKIIYAVEEECIYDIYLLFDIKLKNLRRAIHEKMFIRLEDKLHLTY